MVVCGVSGRSIKPKSKSHTFRQLVRDFVELSNRSLADINGTDLGQLKSDGVDNHLLLGRHERIEEEAGLGPVIQEGRGDITDVGGINDPSGRCAKESLAFVLGGQLGRTSIKSIGTVGNLIEWNHLLAGAVTVVIVDWDSWTIL